MKNVTTQTEYKHNLSKEFKKMTGVSYEVFKLLSPEQKKQVLRKRLVKPISYEKMQKKNTKRINKILNGRRVRF